jgi:hypothetical protein
MNTKAQFTFNCEILKKAVPLNPTDDPVATVRWLTYCEFPQDFYFAGGMALLKSFGTESVAQLLRQSTKFEKTPIPRFQQTEFLLSTVLDYGFNSEQANKAIQAINIKHESASSRFRQITNDEYLYILSTFIYEGPRWVNRFGWRPLTKAESNCLFLYWREMGKRMNIHSIPDTYEKFQVFNEEYEKKFLVPNRESKALIKNIFLQLPGGKLPLISRSAIYLLSLTLEDSLREALGLRKPANFPRQVFNAVMQFKAFIACYFPTRKTAHPHSRL